MSFQAQASHLGVETLSAARRWVQSRIVLRRVLDSKTATTAQVNKAKATYNKAGEDLEAVVVQLERLLQSNGTVVSKNRRKASSKTIPWKEIFGVISIGANALESALAKEVSASPPIKIHTNIIDVEGE